MVISDRQNGRRRVQPSFITDDSFPIIMDIQSITVFQVERRNEYTNYSDAYRPPLLSLLPTLSSISQFLSHPCLCLSASSLLPPSPFPILSLSLFNSPLKSERPHMTRGGRSLYRYLFKLFLSPLIIHWSRSCTCKSTTHSRSSLYFHIPAQEWDKSILFEPSVFERSRSFIPQASSFFHVILQGRNHLSISSSFLHWLRNEEFVSSLSSSLLSVCLMRDNV